MAAIQTVVAAPGQDKGAGDRLALFLKVFAGEVLAAFSRTSLAMDKHVVRTIQNGKSASFPVMGRATAKYLASGDSLDGQRTAILHTEKVINIDGLLAADVLITDIDDAMNHYDVASEYSKQLGEALAIGADGAILATIAEAVNSDENLTGLGKPKMVQVDTATATDAAARGKLVLEGLAQMRGALSTNYVPAGDRYAYVLPDTFSDIQAALMPFGSNFSALGNLEEGTLKNIQGFTVVEVPHLTVGGADGKHVFPTTAGTGAAPKVTAAGVIALIAHRSAVGTVKLKDLALERDRRIEFQADQIVARYSMGHGVLRPEACAALIKKI